MKLEVDENLREEAPRANSRYALQAAIATSRRRAGACHPCRAHSGYGLEGQSLHAHKVYVEDRDVRELVQAFDKAGAPGLAAAVSEGKKPVLATKS